jgi:folate-binding protein YgfZ
MGQSAAAAVGIMREDMSDRLPLHEVHERLGARFAEDDGLLVPGSYGDPAAEHEAVRERAGLIDRSERGKIEVTGKDRATFIHGLVSNEVKGLAPGQGNESALLDVHGKITALLSVHCLADRLLLETDRQLREPLLAGIDRYLFSERAELEDVTAASGILTVAGAAARKIVEQATGAPVPDLARRQHVLVPGATAGTGADLRVVRTDETGEEGYDLWAAPEDLGRLWERLREAGGRPVGREAWNVLRVEAGVVRYGVDVDASTLLLEAPLADAFSLNKGCYLGQEVIARITYRGHVNRKITGLRFADRRVPTAGAPIHVEGKEVGRITSAVLSPALGVALALGFLRREHQAPGTRVEVSAGGELLAAEVNALPFYSRTPAA